MDACDDGLEQLDVHVMFHMKRSTSPPGSLTISTMLGNAIGLKLESDPDGGTGGTVLPGYSGERGRRWRDSCHREPVGDDRPAPSRATPHLCHRLRCANRNLGRTILGYEHAQALHRLNEWTNENIRFYGVKLEVVKQAGCDPSPRFRKVVYPGCWNKEATLPQGDMDPVKRKYAGFFWPLLAKLHGEGFEEKAGSVF